VYGGKSINSLNQSDANKLLLQHVTKLESEEAVAFDMMALLFSTNTLAQRSDISAIPFLEFGALVDGAYKLKPVHERVDRLIVKEKELDP
jgi:hypothetical protein